MRPKGRKDRKKRGAFAPRFFGAIRAERVGPEGPPTRAKRRCGALV
ncbi:DUF6053 domain-containing protein [Lysobacter enzymogenes]